MGFTGFVVRLGSREQSAKSVGFIPDQCDGARKVRTDRRINPSPPPEGLAGTSGWEWLPQGPTRRKSLSSLGMAGLAGFWKRSPRRLWVSRHGPGVHGPEGRTGAVQIKCSRHTGMNTRSGRQARWSMIFGNFRKVAPDHLERRGRKPRDLGPHFNRRMPCRAEVRFSSGKLGSCSPPEHPLYPEEIQGLLLRPNGKPRPFSRLAGRDRR